MTKLDEKDYPNNLLDDILNAGVFTLDPIDPIPDDFMGSLAYVLWTLTERERIIICMRYEKHMTYIDIGKEVGVTRERVRQAVAKALRKLRYPDRLKYLRYGVSGVESRRVRVAAEKAVEDYKKALEDEGKNPALKLGIEEIGLATRSYNVLVRGGLSTVEDVVNLGYDGVCKLRYSGRKTVNDIVRCLRAVGVEF